MSQESEKNIRTQLVGCGLWPDSDSRDPSLDPHAARELQRRCEQRFGVKLRRSFSGRVGTNPMSFGRGEEQSIIELKGGDVLARSSIFSMTVCKAAVELQRRFEQGGGTA